MLLFYIKASLICAVFLFFWCYIYKLIISNMVILISSNKDVNLEEHIQYVTKLVFVNSFPNVLVDCITSWFVLLTRGYDQIISWINCCIKRVNRREAYQHYCLFPFFILVHIWLSVVIFVIGTPSNLFLCVRIVYFPKKILVNTTTNPLVLPNCIKLEITDIYFKYQMF